MLLGFSTCRPQAGRSWMKPTLTPRRTTLSNGSPSVKSTLEKSGQSASPSKSSAPVSKWAVCYEAILRGTEKPQPYSQKDPERFYFDLFCLPVDKARLQELVKSVPDAQLLESGTVKNNVRELFFYAVKAIKTPEADDPRLGNVIDTLRILMPQLLSRPFSNYSYDVMNLLAGSLDQADIVFGDFVHAIDAIFQANDLTLDIKQKVMSLTLHVVSSINQGAINSYFLRRDLFGSVNKLISDATTAVLAPECLLLVGILANYHKYEARNPLLVRFEDLVDEGIMRHVKETAAVAVRQCREAYVQKSDDGTASHIFTVSSLVNSLRWLATPSSPSLARSPSDGPKANSAREDNIYHDMPLEIAAILLAIYDLVNSNKAFCAFLLSEKASETTSEPDLIPSLISLSSYIATHAAVSRRSQLYSRLVFAILTVLIEEGAQTFIPPEHACAVRICRQRQPSLPQSSDEKRPIVCSILDSIALYLRFNIVRKRLDVETYLLVLRLAHKIMHQLKSVRIRISYDWTFLFQSLLLLAQFLVSRQVELSDLPFMEDLIDQVLLTLDFAVVWADVLLPDGDAVAQLFYEILRAEDSISKLSTLTSLGSPPAIPVSPRLGPTASPSPGSRSLGTSTPKSPLQSSFFAFASEQPKGPVAESVRNLGVVRSHFGGRVDDYKEKFNTGNMEAHQILNIIKSSMDGLDLRESMALESGGMARFTESNHESFFQELTQQVCLDVLKITQSHQ